MPTAYVKGRVFNFEYSIGGTGLAGNGFFYPSDFAVGADGLLYVLSKSIEFAPAAGITCCTFEPKVLWESRGNDFLKDTGPLPSAIAVDKDKTVYVADEFNNRIYLYDEEGSYAGVWREGDQYTPAPVNEYSRRRTRLTRERLWACTCRRSAPETHRETAKSTGRWVSCSTVKKTYMSPTATTTASRCLRRTGPSSGSGAATVTVRASSICPGA